MQTPSLADFFPTMPVVSTTSRANGAATGAHNPASPGLRPGTSLRAVLAARASATPAGGRDAAAASVTPSPAATGGASVGTNDGGTAPEEGTAAAAVLDGAAMQISDLVTAVTAANQAVLAPAADLYEHLIDGSQKVIVVVAEDSTSPEALLLHSISDAAQAGDIVAMVGEIGGDGYATLVRVTEAACRQLRKKEGQEAARRRDPHLHRASSRRLLQAATNQGRSAPGGGHLPHDQSTGHDTRRPIHGAVPACRRRGPKMEPHVSGGADDHSRR